MLQKGQVYTLHTLIQWCSGVFCQKKKRQCIVFLQKSDQLHSFPNTEELTWVQKHENKGKKSLGLMILWSNLHYVLQSGSCKPPTECNFAYLNETYWMKPSGPSNSSNPDCDTWSNDQSELCYACQSCKAGVLANLKNSWKKIAITNAALIALLLVVYSLGCCVLRNNRRHKYTLVGK